MSRKTPPPPNPVGELWRLLSSRERAGIDTSAVIGGQPLGEILAWLNDAGLDPLPLTQEAERMELEFERTTCALATDDEDLALTDPTKALEMMLQEDCDNAKNTENTDGIIAEHSVADLEVHRLARDIQKRLDAAVPDAFPITEKAYNKIELGDLVIPTFVWAFNNKNKKAMFSQYPAEFCVLDYRALVHPDDIGRLRRQLRSNISEQRRRDERSRALVSLHRVKDSNGEYHAHLSVITLRRNKKKLILVSGTDFRLPAEISQSTAELHYLSEVLHNGAERFSPFFQWIATRIRIGGKSLKRADPFFQTWRCGNYIISPSLFRMVKIGDNPVELSSKQAHFMALLLDSETSVERAAFRRHVFGRDHDLPSDASDMDGMVSFFKRHLGRFSIRADGKSRLILKRGRYVCEGEELRRAFSALRGSDDHDTDNKFPILWQ